MLVELETRPRSRINFAKYWGEISHLSRPWLAAGPRDILVTGDLPVYRAALDAAGIIHTARTRMLVTPRAFRVDRLPLGARVRIRQAREVDRAREIAENLGVLVVADDATCGR